MSSPVERSSFLIEGGDVVLPDRVIRPGMVFVHEGSIRYAGSSDRPGSAGPAGSLPVIDATGLFVCPALWEPHIHGCAGATTENATPDSLRHMAGYLASQGVGAFVPTTVGDESYVGALGAALEAVAAERELASRIPGIHVEGPYVNPVRRGGIPEAAIKPFSTAHLDRLAGLAKGRLRVMTFAPEVEGGRAIAAALAKKGIIPSLGHSDAAFEDLAALEGLPILSVTHLFNAMSGVSHRKPGLALWALLNREAFTEIIGDLVHVHPAAIQLALRARPNERIVLVSDAIAAAGWEGGELTLYGRKLVAKGNGLYYADSGVLVGSRALVRDAVAGLVTRFGVSVSTAVAMASLNPARMFGAERKGALLPGYDADVALFAKDFSSCRLTLWQGRPIHGTGPVEAPAAAAGR
ncbi:MAG: amidohydrolase family protein [Spirochaetes bacterium]|nr:amidohydrolase family protein [Spirochaetota bacterium]